MSMTIGICLRNDAFHLSVNNRGIIAVVSSEDLNGNVKNPASNTLEIPELTEDFRQLFLARNKLVASVNQAPKNQQMMTNSSIEEILARMIDAFVSMAKNHVLMKQDPAVVKNHFTPTVVVSVFDEIPSAKRHVYVGACRIAGFDENHFRLVNESTAVALAHVYGVAQPKSIDCEAHWEGKTSVENEQLKSRPAADYICVLTSKERGLKPAFKCALFRVERKTNGCSTKIGSESLQMETLDTFDFDPKCDVQRFLALVGQVDILCASDSYGEHKSMDAILKDVTHFSSFGSSVLTGNVNTVHYSLETIALGAALIDGFSPICNSTDEATVKHVVVVEKYPFLLTYEVQYDGEEDERQIRSLDTTIGLKYSLQGNSDLNVTKIRPKQLIRDDEKEVEFYEKKDVRSRAIGQRYMGAKRSFAKCSLDPSFLPFLRLKIDRNGVPEIGVVQGESKFSRLVLPIEGSLTEAEVSQIAEIFLAEKLAKEKENAKVETSAPNVSVSWRKRIWAWLTQTQV